MAELCSARSGKMIELMKLQRSRCSILPLVLKGKWFDMIARGEKREEYRLPTIYWRKRLHNWDRKFTENTSPIVEFRRGYAKDAPRMAFWCRGIETVSGLRPYAYVEFPADRCLHPEWGEPTDPHFFIQLGGRVELTNSENVEVPCL